MDAGAAPVIDIDEFLEAQESKDRLRFIMCGSAGDGKSTLLGRLLFDSKTIFEDQLSATRAESRRFGAQGKEVDFALLVDGLQAEREQGFTIDVAYRYFESDRRKFIAADAPGHERYTRNMATGASTADAAVILVDARAGVLTQTRRHSHIVALFGIRHLIVAVNKMDLAGYEQAAFDEIVSEFTGFARELGVEKVHGVPLSALTGDNVLESRGAMPWYGGPPLMELLESIQTRPDGPEDDDEAGAAFRLPVQCVSRLGAGIRGFCGTIASGEVRRGMTVVAGLSGKRSTVSQILAPSQEQPCARAGQAVTVTLNDEIDISRGDMLANVSHPPEVADQFAAHVLWMDPEPMLAGRGYFIRFATATAMAQVTDLVHQVDIDTLDKLAAKTLELNGIGYCKLALDRAVPFDAYADNRQTGGFVLIDRFTNATVGAGVVDFALRRASNIEWHEMKLDKAARARANQQRPCVLWFTGLSGSGKSTVADRLEQKLHSLGRRTYLLDGDNVRHGLNKDLGFTDQDRVENIRRVSEVAKLMADAGLIVLASFISPFRSERQMARALMDEGEFIEVFVDTPLNVCEARDPKGLYKKARAGELKNFTGIDSDYETPQNAEIVLKAGEAEPDALVEQIVEFLKARGS